MNVYALAGIIAGIVIVLGAIGLKLYGRSQRKLGGSQARSKGQEKVIEDVDKAKRAVHDLGGPSPILRDADGKSPRRMNDGGRVLLRSSDLVFHNSGL
jgi:hypothetical protein